MATVAESGLFPPVINAYMPAFNIADIIDQDSLNILFSLSPYNTPGNVKSAHISITRQSNYKSLFKSNLYPLGIYPHNFNPGPTVDTGVSIPLSKLELNQFAYNEYYKVQVRLSNEYVPNDSLTGKKLSNYLTNEEKLRNFSEWSTVCLIRFIAPPKFTLDGNGTQFTPNINSNVINSSMLTLSGVYSKDNVNIPDGNYNIENGKNDAEYLSSYGIKVDFNNERLFDSGELSININNPNSINYTIPFYFEPTQEDLYTIRLYFTTANLYQNEIIYPLNVHYSSSEWGSQQNPVMEVTSLDSVIGKVNINIVSKTEGADIAAGSKVVIRRASADDDFTIWDTIYTKTILSDMKMVDFNDFTIESGLIYKYEINYIINNTTYTIVEGPVLSVFDNAFLTGEGTQLCVRFNPNLSSYKRNVSDNIVNTIGSKYPYITRNGMMDYRTFSLSGTIAYEMDLEHQFTSRTKIYGDWIDVYGSYFVNHYFNQQNDRVTQRKFREIVEDYFYDDIPKLFRSTPEGNILVRITDVNLTPNNQLGRMIYDFSLTATEIGECSVDNYKLYQIQDFGDE